MDINIVRTEILREAERNGNQVCKLKNDAGDFVRVKRGYSQPSDLRQLYLEALTSLVEDGLLRTVFSNRDLELFDVVSPGGHICTPGAAYKRIIDELKTSGRIYKIHSDRGEFIQCGTTAYDEDDEERISFLGATRQLIHEDVLTIVNESRTMTIYELANPSHTGFVQYMHHGHA
jgi:ribonucleotide monophosphatase NagD (HAD superfamily)